MDIQTLPENTNIQQDTKFLTNQAEVIRYQTVLNKIVQDIVSDNISNPSTQKFLSQVGLLSLLAGYVTENELNTVQAALTALSNTYATTTSRGLAYLVKPITITNNATTPNSKIDFSNGIMNFHDGSGQATASALTKILQSSGSWIAGNDQNGLFSGARANNTWYYLFAIYNSSIGVVDFGYDTNVSATNRPAGYTKYQLLQACKTDASGNIITGTYFKDGWFWYNSRQVEFDWTGVTSTNLTLSFYPPGINGFAYMNAVSNMSSSTGARRIRIGASALNLSIDTGFTYGDTYVSSGSGVTSVNSSNQIYIITNGTGSSQLYINGFKLNL
jgi:hypothetical protein